MTISATTQGIKPGVCTSTNRPANPFDGQVISETDTDSLKVYNGSSWLSVGKIIQVVNAVYATDVLNTTTTYAATGLTATITPTLSTSKVLVLVNQNVGKHTGNTDSYAWLQLKRGSTVLSTFYVGPYTATSMYLLNVSATTSYLDSPATTSATTYSTQFKNNVAADGARVQWQNADSTITLIEVAT